MRKILTVMITMLIVCTTVNANGNVETSASNNQNTRKAVEMTPLEMRSKQGSLMFITGAPDDIERIGVWVFEELPVGDEIPILSALSYNNIKTDPLLGKYFDFLLCHSDPILNTTGMDADPKMNMYGIDYKPWRRSGNYYIAIMEVTGRDSQGRSFTSSSFNDAWIYCEYEDVPQKKMFGDQLHDPNKGQDTYSLDFIHFKKYSELNN